MQKPIEGDVIVMISFFSVFLPTSERRQAGGFFCSHDLIITVHVGRAECMSKLGEKGLVTAPCGSDVLAPAPGRTSQWAAHELWNGHDGVWLESTWPLCLPVSMQAVD